MHKKFLEWRLSELKQTIAIIEMFRVRKKKRNKNTNEHFSIRDQKGRLTNGAKK